MNVIIQATISEHLDPLKHKDENLFLEVCLSMNPIVINNLHKLDTLVLGLDAFREELLRNSSHKELLAFEELGVVAQICLNYQFKNKEYKHYKLETLLRNTLQLKGDALTVFAEDLFLNLYHNWKKFYDEDINSNHS